MPEHDKHGHVILPDEPADGLPADLFRLLEDYVIREAGGSSFERAWNLQDLVREWSDLEDESQVGKWLESHHRQPYVAPSRGIQGQARSHDDVDISPDIWMALATETLLLTDGDEQTLRMQSLQDLTNEWMRLNTDMEKLVGHLMLVHKVDSSSLESSEDVLHALHAKAHREDASAARP